MTFFDNMSNFRAFNDLIDSKLEKRFKKKVPILDNIYLNYILNDPVCPLYYERGRP